MTDEDCAIVGNVMKAYRDVLYRLHVAEEERDFLLSGDWKASERLERFRIERAQRRAYEEGKLRPLVR